MRIANKILNKPTETYLHPSWLREYVHLKCQTCGEHIKLNGVYGDALEYKQAEMIAAANSFEPHKCAANVLQLEEAKRLMRAYREKHPGITFEESMEVYKLILSQI